MSGNSLKMGQMDHFESNIETNKRPPKMNYPSALGPYWNEYGNQDQAELLWLVVSGTTLRSRIHGGKNPASYGTLT